jgi:hypothetical protein
LEWTDVSEVLTASVIRAMMEAVRTSETSIHSNDTTERYTAEDSELQLLHVQMYYYHLALAMR